MSGATADTVHVCLCMCAVTKMLAGDRLDCLIKAGAKPSFRFKMIIHSGKDWKQLPFSQ